MRWRVLSIVVLATSCGLFGFSLRHWMLLRHRTPWQTEAAHRSILAEGRVAVTEIAWGVALCAERAGALPDTTAKIPASMKAIDGRAYQSKLSDWNDAAFVCADFHMHRPQHFQYQWVRGAAGKDGNGGLVEAVADFDGDGVVDHTVRLAVRCDGSSGALRCLPDPMLTEPFPSHLSTERLE